LIDNVRRDLFVAISFETKQPVPNRYAIASKAAPSAYVAYHSAFEYPLVVINLGEVHTPL